MNEVGDMDEFPVALAREVAFRAHIFDQRHDGSAYIEHVRAVAEGVSSPREQTAAWLHDVVEHGHESAASLRALGFDTETVFDVMALSRRPDERYNEYIERLAVSGSDAAVAVKLADLRHNLHSGSCPTNLRERYRRALRRLVLRVGEVECAE